MRDFSYKWFVILIIACLGFLNATKIIEAAKPKENRRYFIMNKCDGTSEPITQAKFDSLMSLNR